MKIRSGFVSNSSSSSFLMYGAYLDSCEIRDLADKLIKDEDIKEHYNKYGDYYEGQTLDDMETYELNELVESKLDLDLTVESPYDGENLCFGLSWSDVKDNETGKQFKARVAKEIKKLEKLVGHKLELGTHAEAWNS